MRFTAFVKQSELIKSRLLSIQDQVGKFSEIEDLNTQQKARLKVLATTANLKHTEYEKLVSKLYNTSPLPEDIDDNVVSDLQETILNAFVSIQSTVNVMLPPSLDTTVGEALNASGSAQPAQSSINLPRINLTCFSGQPSDWIAFHSLFENAIHKNETISNVEKFTYLLSCVTNEPLDLIKSLPVTNANYCIAWNILLKRYHNSRLLVTLHVNNLLDLPQLNHPSVKQLRSFLSSYNENVQALNTLGHDVSKENLIFTSHILRKFDQDIRSKFEHSRDNSKDLPKIEEFIKFLENECSSLEAANLTTLSQQSVNKNSNFTKIVNVSNKAYTGKSNKVAMFTSNAQQHCAYCTSNTHNIYRCTEFSALSVQARQSFIRQRSLCQNCFGTHKLNECKSLRNCSACNKRHHSMLHFQQPARNPQLAKNNAALRQGQNVQDHVQSNETTFAGISRNKGNTVLLGTALIVLSTENGYKTVVRAVLDSASQTSFISESCANTLKLRRSHARTDSIHGISSSQVKTKGISRLTISALEGSVLAPAHPVTILEKITGDLPKMVISPEIKLKLNQLGLVLADPTFDTPAPIDALIGADLFALCMKGTPVSLGKNLPFTIRTIFGNILLGSAPTYTKPVPDHALVTLLTVNELDLHKSIQKFWALEEPPNAIKLSPEDKLCEEHFMKTHSRTETGRYVCSLPFASDPDKLGDSSKVALKMFCSLENKFAIQPAYKELYQTFMKDYSQNGHMQPCIAPKLNEPHYILPHHGVMKNDKIRVVFNASAPTSSSLSLNDVLYQGPKLHNEISDIIFKFRLPKVVFTCDIKQMFRQIKIKADDQHFQLIYWREHPSQPIQIYQLTTVTYGMKSSPYLANRVIQQLISDEGQHHPLAAQALRQMIYVDDAILGSDSEEQALLLQQDLIQLLSKGGFELRKWASNSQALLDIVPEDHRETPLNFCSSEQTTFSILGLRWNSRNDVFSYAISTPSEPYTKRSVLSAIARIYDPCGWLTPVVLWAKAMMQHLWSLGLQWNDELPTSYLKKWHQFIAELPALETLEISRHVDFSTAKTIQLHGFSDASETAYASCVYIRLEYENGEVIVRLLIGKSRVAPLKHMTLPRLELCGAHLLSKLLHYCTQQLSQKYKIDSISAWCDSTVTLHWIHTPSNRLKTFVANRVAEIQELTPPKIWMHVPSKSNPADSASRGIMPKEILNHHLWWNGPDWLKNHNPLPISSFKFDKRVEIPELKQQTTVSLLTATQSDLTAILHNFSSWRKLQCVFAYILRFIKCLKTKKKIEGSLTLTELNAATRRVCWLIQQDNFAQDLSHIEKGKPCTPRVQRLAPFLDEEGLLRVGGRLRNSSLETSAKHPILLPKKHHIVNLLIDYYHILYLHAGPQFLQATLAQCFWILSARGIIRSRIFKCIRCFKTKPPVAPPLMGDLPLGRVVATRPFSTSGVDYAGPFHVKLHVLRRLQAVKIYICLFICFATKAVHLEVVTDLTTEAYIAALTRFISRRGLITNLHSDCGSNFLGAVTKLRKCFQDLTSKPETQRFAQQNQINFHLLPPHAPHQGGLWERAIKSAKHHLRRVVGTQILTYEEFITLTVRIEAMLNSRPISPMSSDPNDLQPLTPGHFLTGGPLTSIIEPQYEYSTGNRLRRWQQVQSFAQHIWTRWHQEYLQTLQQRSKWTTLQDNLKIGDLVVIHDTNTPPLTWHMGRIISVSPGADGVVRVVHLKTSSGNLSRPALKVSRLPIN